jgi:hypothetical protein
MLKTKQRSDWSVWTATATALENLYARNGLAKLDDVASALPVLFLGPKLVQASPDDPRSDLIFLRLLFLPAADLPGFWSHSFMEESCYFETGIFEAT